MTATISTQKAAEILREQYGITATLEELPGDIDRNFACTTASDTRYVFKFFSEEISPEFIDFQTLVLQHVASKKLPLKTPESLPNKEGKTIGKVIINDNPLHFLLLQWLPGRIWVSVNPKTDALRYSLGQQAARITAALQDFQHPEAKRNFHWNLPQSLWTVEHLSLFSEEEQQLVSYFQQRFKTIQPCYKNLPHSVVHNDLNDHNILVSADAKAPVVTGIIDFGDAVYTQTMNDLAIVLAYAVMELPDTLAAAVAVIKGYHSYYPISEKEIECLYVLVAMRWVTTVTKAAIRKKEGAASLYHTISEKPAWEALKKWYLVHEHFATYTFRAACGFTAHPLEDAFKTWAASHQVSLQDMFPTLSIEKATLLDMSVGSPLLGTREEYSDAEISQFRLNQLQKQHPRTILANGYLETRPFYTTEAFKSEGNNGPQYRTVHLGTDFWVPDLTPVHVPFNGVVKIVHHNNYDKDYGPMLIVEHTFHSHVFYTLYGHLTLTSLQQVQVGQKVQQGELLAYIGAHTENGNWAPHLHFQLIFDLLGNNENFNGVAFPSEKEVWRSLCPDPNLIFKENLTPTVKKPSEEQLLQFRKEHLGKGLSLSYDTPLHIVRGEGVYLIDTDGRKYLDTVNNVNHVGHQHPKVVAAGQRQMAILTTNTRYLHEEIVTYAEALLKKLPSELSVIHIVNSGSEANELALRMARTCTGKQDILAIEVGYHGNTTATMDVSSYKFNARGGSGKPAATHLLPLPDPYRGTHTETNCGTAYATYAQQIIEQLQQEGKEIAGFIGESMVSCGGQIVPPANYFKEVYRHVRAAGGICIADEVQTGFGRMGKTFWAFELYDVIPDIVTMGKPAGNGHPLAVVACTREVADAFNTDLEFFNTFGGNPVACAIGRTVLEVIEEENLQQNALTTGTFLLEALQKLKTEFPIIGDVRGEGLFLGFELNDAQKRPLEPQATYLVNRMKTLGILMSTDGPDRNVIKIKPPLVFSVDNAKELIFRLKTVLQEDFMQVLI